MFSIRTLKFIGICIFLALLIIANNFGYLDFAKGLTLRVTQPVLRLVSGATLSVKEFFYSLATVKRQIAERDELEKEVKRLNAANAALLEQREENADLRTLLGLKQGLKMTTVSAAVVSRDPTGIVNTVVIDSGSDAGISRGDAVLDEFGSLMGVVKEVFARSAEFSLITDSLVKIDVKVAGKDILGIIGGSHGLGLNLDLVSQSVKVEKGDKIVTSGLTGSLPKDILIGTADEQQSGSSELFQKLSVIPAAKLKDFRFVLVVTGF